jgi:hypothetical protein
MDAFDIRMQTFGGKQAQNKSLNLEKFMSEKRGFIRASNGYKHSDPMEIVEKEV